MTALAVLTPPDDDAPERDRLKALSNDDLLREFKDCLGITVFALMRARACYLELRSRGVDLSDLRGAAVEVVRRLADGLLLPEVAALLYDPSRRWWAVLAGKLPVPLQERIMGGERFPLVALPGNDGTNVIPTDARDLENAEQFRQLFDGPNVRTAGQQVVYLHGRRMRQDVASLERSGPFTVDPDGDSLVIKGQPVARSVVEKALRALRAARRKRNL